MAPADRLASGSLDRGHPRRPLRLGLGLALITVLCGATPLVAQETESRTADPEAEALVARAKGLREQLKRDPATSEALTAILEELRAPRWADNEDIQLSLEYCLRTLAGHFRKANDAARAIPYYEAALEVALANEQFGKASYDAIRLYALFASQGERAGGTAALEEALEVVPEEYVQRVQLLLYLGLDRKIDERWDEALTLFQEAWRLTIPKDGTIGTAHVDAARALADTYISLGLIDLAAKWTEQESELVARLQLDSLGDRQRFAGRSAVRRANLRLTNDDWQRAADEIESALADGDGFRSDPGTRSALFLRLGVAFSMLEDRDPQRERRAEKAFRTILSPEESSSAHDVHSARLRLAEVYLRESRFEEARLLLSAVEESEADARRSAAFDQLDQAHLTVLQNQLARRTSAAPEIRQERWSALLRESEALLELWRAKEPRPGGIGFLATLRARELFDEIILTALELEGRERGSRTGADWLLETQPLGSLARRMKAPEVDVAKIQRELIRSGEGVLLFLPSRHRSWAIAIDTDHVECFELAPEHRIESLRGRLVSEIVTSPFGLSESDRLEREQSIDRLSRELSDLLFPSALSECVLGWDAVTIAAPDLLRYLPFECLPVGVEGPLGLARPIGYYPSLSIALILEQRAGRRSAKAERDMLFVISPELPQDESPESRLASLDMTSAQREALLRPWHPADGDVLSGAAASLTAWKAALSSSTTGAHLIVHGIRDAERERSAGLLLSAASTEQDGRVWSEDIEAFDSVPPLVLLTACGTGRGPERCGDGAVSHLGGAFFLRGAEAIALPFADLAYEPTLALSATLHERLRAGDSLAEALHRSRIERAGSNPDPFYWALLHATGRVHRRYYEPVVVEAESGSRWLLWTLAGGAMVGVALWIYRRR
ncbi:MAG: CHAT domain-containing protein [Planctomycetota bacterium]